MPEGREQPQQGLDKPAVVEEQEAPLVGRILAGEEQAAASAEQAAHTAVAVGQAVGQAGGEEVHTAAEEQAEEHTAARTGRWAEEAAEVLLEEELGSRPGLEEHPGAMFW